MSRIRITRPPHPAPALLLAAALAAGGIGAAAWSNGARDDALAALSATQRRQAGLMAEMAALRQQQHALQPALEHWNALASLGAMQPPDPPAWAAEAARIQARQGIDGGALRFATSRPLGDAESTKHALILAHPLEIDAALRHEGRLPALIAALASMRGALILPRDCTLARRGADADTHVHARCQLDWLTVSVATPEPAR